MLITKSVEIKATGSLIKKYNTKYDEIILIPIEELSIGSHALVECSCDYCGVILIMEYRSFLKRSNIINKTCCKKCSPIKQKEINLLLYGVENVFELDSIKEKIKETCLEKYGVENPGWTKESQEKIKKTCLDRYGVENPLQSEEIKNKIKETNLERYGVENPGWTIETQVKIKETNLEKYGVEYPSQCQEIKDKIIESNLRIYGVSYSQTLDIVKDKVKETNMERYGVEYPSQLEFFQDKAKQTCLNRYGVENYSQSDDYQNKYKKSLSIKEYNGYKYQCSYELNFLKFCEFNKIVLSNKIPKILYTLNESIHRYYADFYYEKHNLIIEIKSTYWYNKHLIMNQEKRKQTKLDGYNYILIMDKNYDEFIEKYLN